MEKEWQSIGHKVKMINRRCAKCQITQELTNFYKNKGEPLGYSYTCMSCALQYNRDWRKNNKKRAREITQNWKNRNPEKVYNSKIKREYNITIQEFDTLLQKQNNECAICYTKIEKPYIAKDLNIESAYIDHCHKTDKNRGLLCQHCNTGLGFFKDNIDNLIKAIVYLNNQASNDEKDKHEEV
jgi:hypothetical protein